MVPDPTFEMKVSGDQRPGSSLVVGLSHFGMAGLSAVDYLVRHTDAEQIGHISPDEFPAIAPFQNGEPRHHTRLYHLSDVNISVLVGELFVPVWAAHSFADAIVDWVDSVPIEEIAILHGVPYPHGPDEHGVFHVSTPTYHTRRIAETDIQPLGGGLFDGVVGEIVTRSLDDRAPPTGVYVTPAHPPGPDLDAALVLLDAIQDIYDISVDAEELKQRSEELKQYYTELSERMQSISDGEQPLGSRDYPDDRMYM
ncbi:proteasome assembly chaperone family protein [Halapricum desulfuricans]|uniref:Archaeal enzyme of ATP-grasp superfamily n=1 Tax=Halapricum desulfuricans TaxID=2841257 RepID=A0A897NPQ7_9EURY|nr:PAC2 family protein [Halapricum desulfuricans]QSG14738.1 Archaeal enzyme of ATP-grasp superfamily [Halapricum desulfuricans]